MKNFIDIEKWCQCKDDIERVLSAIYIHIHFQSGQYPENVGLFSRTMDKIRENKLYNRDFGMFQSISEMKDICECYQIDIVVWTYKRSRKGNYSIVSSFTSGQNAPNLRIINVLAPHFKKRMNFRGLKLITNIDFYAKKADRVRFFDHLAKHFGNKISAYNLMVKWGSSSVQLKDEKRFYEVFNVGFSIFKTRKLCEKKKSGELGTNTEVKELYTSKFEVFLKLELQSESSLTTIEPYQSFTLCSSVKFDFYACGTKLCQFVTQSRAKSERHKATCTGETIWTYEQKRLNENSIHSFLVKNGYIPEQYLFDNFATFDIECLGSKPDKDDDDQATTIVKNLQFLISIAVDDSFSNKPPKFFLREDSTKKGLENLVSSFFAYLNDLQALHENNMPEWFRESLMAITLKIRGLKLLKLRDGLHKKKLRQKKAKNTKTSKTQKERIELTSILRKLFTQPDLILLKREYRKLPANGINQYIGARKYMERMKSLRVIGYNSERYDLPVILPAFIQIIKGETTDFQTIKRGTGYMSLRVNDLSFIDAKV